MRSWRAIMIGVIAFAAAFWLLRETRSITMPLVTALLLALAVWPMVGAISRNMPRSLKWLGPLAGLLVVLLLLLAFMVALGVAANQVYGLVGDMGPRLSGWLAGFGLSSPEGGEQGGIASIAFGSGSAMSTAMTALGLTARTLGGIVLILFLMLLMLTEVESWHRKFIAVSADSSDRTMRETGRSVGQKFRTYFNTRVLLGAITAALYVGWLALFGVDYLLLWGLLAVLLNFIPTVGSIVAGLLPVAYAFVSKDPGTAAMIAAGLLVIEQIMGNLIDPLILGRRIAVSPLVVLVSLGFWTILWGIPGAILAVPLTVLVILAMAHFDALKPAALLLTDRSSFEELEEFRRSS
ncbi:AI-2E family transporter [Altererythrobacter soli]|uniref:AI-2E family transporter n=1 Tax=Croceibacterium soli TaxID=1739690 RepID=A0A6I4UTP6_9SPHN|nr:AI-2E family transporter [Croceibacterium soli]MXP40887.1 AI-2E family transporter [Croceibacterium soli]